MTRTEPTSPTDELLVVDGLHVAYGRTAALKGVDLVVGAGEVVAVTGPSGSGKSTLLLTMAAVLTPDRGDVRFGGASVSGASESARAAMRRSEIGVLFQYGQLVPELTVAENVTLPLLLGGMRRPEARGRAGEWLDRLGVADLAAHDPAQISGGQAQRVALARAMVTDPALLLADEPTGSLDTVAGEAVMHEILTAVRGRGAAAVIVTHEARVAAYADREVHLRDGLVVGRSAPGRAPGLETVRP